MATAVPSPLASSVEKTNGAKLSRLLIDGGTTVLRKVFDRFHPPANLDSDLHSSYPTLNNLLLRRILNGHQWDKLFPPDGAAPDSHTFDITLLFLLLTNICGLSPPPSGWHTKPAASDTSLEANLARIKFFRNVLYGHVSTTAVDTSTFSALWQEITLPLTALGLDEAEIDKLKAESCGEEAYLDALFKWADSEEDIKSQLKNVRRTVEQVRQTVNEVAAGLQQVGEAVHSFKEGRGMERTDGVLRNLAKAEFKGDIEHYVQRFQADTREWAFNRVQNWLDDRTSPNRVMVISGNAGMGKSVMAAVICQRMQDAGRLSGNHFCQHNNARYRNPQLMLQSLACHLSHALPEYKQALVEQLSRNLGSDLNSMGVEALFALLFKEPLGTLSDPGSNMLMVIDGLDESEYHGRNELLDVIANQFCKLPSWIRFLLTTRPATNITEKLKHLKPFQLEAEDKKNIQDIRIVLQKKLQHVIKAENRGDILEKLVLKCEGLMLYAHFRILAIEENPSVLDKDLDDSLPLGISSVYSSYFKRLESELLKEDNVKEENFLNLLCAITASREPLPIDFVSRLLLPGEDSPLAKRRILKALGTVSSLLPIRNGCLHVIHKSVEDWLTDSSCYGEHDFIVEKKQGHRILASLCTAEVDELKQKGVHNVQFSATEKYALCHSARHMFYSHKEIRRDRLEELTKAYVTDLELLFAKLCVGSAIAAEDVIWFQKQGISSLLSEDIQSILNTLKHLLRKYHDIFTSHPHLLWQNVLNEGGAVLSGEASNLLQKKYPEIPYMEEVCEMIKFSPDNRFLLCVSISHDLLFPAKRAFHVNVTFREQSRVSLIVSSGQVCYDPKTFDFVSDRGFLLGDAVPPTSTGKHCFVLDKHTALTFNWGLLECIDMVSTDKVAENSKGEVKTRKIALSSDGETVYVVLVSQKRFLVTDPRVVAWDVSSGKLIAEKNTGMATNTCLVSVTEGVLLETSDGYLELWRADLSERIRRWTNLSRIKKVIPVSDERVACVTEEKVTVLDTTSGNILSIIPAFGEVVGCNSKLQILTSDGANSYLLYDGTSVFWKRKLCAWNLFSTGAFFSPTEQFVIIYHEALSFGFVLDAVLGNTLYMLDLSPYTMKRLRFISDENYVVAGLSSVHLYNIKFGDFLSEINIESGAVGCLAVCPSKRLLAIGVDDHNHRYKVIRVWLPGDKDIRKS